ncbi:hypothetical protein LIER_31331 [Lithospermum erythrorhizon]|uniref:DUF4371 domain-containing protein n=1 Tax=Lithospermum erythrorhizon TaxID=34254 RepID=A0AAV3RUF0_LITER
MHRFFKPKPRFGDSSVIASSSIVHVEETSTITLKGALENLLFGFGLCIAQIRGQGYDVANNIKVTRIVNLIRSSTNVLLCSEDNNVLILQI